MAVIDHVIFVPGIMGSRLVQATAAGGGPVWDENTFSSISRLVRNPALTKFPNPGLVADLVLMTVKVTPVAWLNLHARLDAALTTMAKHGHIAAYKAFPYDWRQDVYDSARQLGDFLARTYGFGIDGHGHQEVEKERRLKLVAHSMGGLVVAAALSRGFIHPENVSRLILVGSPLRGAPSAFRGMFTTGYLPGMDWIGLAVNFRKNRIACNRILLEMFQSFPSMYQLLPPATSPYLRLPGASLMNPLSNASMPLLHANPAGVLHNDLQKFEQLLSKNGVDYRLIFSTASSRGFLRGAPDDTDELLDAQIRGTGPQPTYAHVTVAVKGEGDGTVPADSATSGNRTGVGRLPVVGVQHAYMCHNRQVVQLIATHLP